MTQENKPKDSKIVMPGDVVFKMEATPQETPQKIIIGPGLQRNGAEVYAVKCGRYLESKQKTLTLLWVDSSQKRYVPVENEKVIGIVTERMGDGYTVDIGGNVFATLDSLAFEGATKKNKPNLQIGTLVYARFLLAHKDMTPQLTCIDKQGRNVGMGELTNGYLFTCSTGLARKLLSPKCVLLESIGKSFAYEITVGLNGRVWVNAETETRIIILANAIINCEFMNDDQCQEMVSQLVKHNL